QYLFFCQTIKDKGSAKKIFRLSPGSSLHAVSWLNIRHASLHGMLRHWLFRTTESSHPFTNRDNGQKQNQDLSGYAHLSGSNYFILA
ncbi:MAG: hypothetical protein KKE53_18160, partial [Proteobacteria bacterium]|nr:hypothetical protein [Pseudomonadota bacterium]